MQRFLTSLAAEMFAIILAATLTAAAIILLMSPRVVDEPTSPPAPALVAHERMDMHMPQAATSSESAPVPRAADEQEVTSTSGTGPKKSPENSETDGQQAAYIEMPYETPRLTPEGLNVLARSTLVNIFCSTPGSTLEPVSASGVIIDPRGIILTNAHVAQYLLLAQSPSIELTCTIRTGAPAHDAWSARVLYLPGRWVEEHAASIQEERPVGTGESDFALLLVIDSLHGTLPASFPFVAPDTREGLFRVGLETLVASYPAGFLGAASARSELYPVSTLTTIQKLFTFDTNTVDLVSLGGIIVAQGGSSGGAVVNNWGRLIGLVATAQDGETTEERDLRAITLAHVNRDLRIATGKTLTQFLEGDPVSTLEAFWQTDGPLLQQRLIDEL